MKDKKIISVDNVEGKYKIVTFEDGTKTREYWPGFKAADQINKTFTTKELNEEQKYRFNKLEQKAKEYAELLVKYCQDNRNRAMALTNLEVAHMCARAAILTED